MGAQDYGYTSLGAGHSALLEAIVESSQEAIIAKSLDGTVISWNPAAERIFGYTAEEAIGQSITFVIPANKMEEHWQLTEKLERGERVAPFETECVRKDGRTIEVLLSLSPLLDVAGQPVGVSAVVSDLTHAKELERSRHATEVRLDLATEAAGIGVWEWCLTTNRVTCSANLEKIHRLPPGAFSGTLESVVQQVLPEDRPTFMTSISEAIRTGEEFRTEYRLAHAPQIWVAGIGRAVDTGEGKRMVGVCMDVTERKRLEQTLLEEAALLESESRFRELAEAMPHMVWTMLPDGTVTYANHRCAERMGAIRGLSILDTVPLFVHPEDLPMAIRKLRATLDMSAAAEFEARISTGSELQHWHLVRLIPVCDAGGKSLRWVGSATDVDIQRRAAQLLKTTAGVLGHTVNERTSQFNDIAASLESLLYNIGHNLRAPLRAMSGFSQILVEECANPLSAEAHELANRIVSAATRMDHIINDLLAYGHASQRELRCQGVDLDVELDHTLARFNSRIQQKRAVITVRHPLPRVWGNSNAIRAVFEQLIDNALKFHASKEAPHILIRAEHRNGKIRFWITDNGLGIALDHQSRIFRPFESLHSYEMYAGTGMGLALCSKLTERMNGAIGVVSALGRGSSFWFELPADRSEPLPFLIQESDFNFLPPADAVVITSGNGWLRWMNPAFARMCGHSLDEIAGRKPGEMLQGPHSDPVEIQRLRAAIRQRISCSVTLVNYRKNGEPYWVEIALAPFRRSPQASGFVSVEREVQIPIPPTTRLELHRELRQVIRTLRAAPVRQLHEN